MLTLYIDFIRKDLSLDVALSITKNKPIYTAFQQYKMQANLLQKIIDQQLSSALQNTGVNGSQFQWYLALQLDDITHYDAKNEALLEYEEPYSSINLPSAPKPSLYAHQINYKQSSHQSKVLQLSKQPALSIQLFNYLHPHSLHWSKEEQIIPDEIIQNCPLHTQKNLLLQKHGSAQMTDANTPVESGQLKPQNDSTSDNSIRSQWDTLPTDYFVDTTLENTVNAAKMIL